MEKIFAFLKKYRLCILILLALIAQQVFFIAKFPPVYEIDTPSYYEPAQHFIETGTLFSGRRMPGYPLAIAAAIRLCPNNPDMLIITVQHIMGILIWIASLFILSNRRQRILFSLFWFADLLFNSYQHCILTDAPMAFFVFMSAAALFLLRYSGTGFLISGLCVSLAFLMKPVMYLFFLFALPIFYFSADTWKERLRKYGLFILFPVLTINAVCLNNYRLTGKYVFMPYSASYYIEYVINFNEIPENSRTKGIIDWDSYHRPMDNEQKMAAASEVVDKLSASGFSISEADSELKKIALYSAIRHPLLFLRKMGIETAHFYLNAHNHYVKHFYKGRMPFSMGMAIREGDYIGAAKKMLFSLHFMYWLLFLLFLYSIYVYIRKSRYVLRHGGFKMFFDKAGADFFSLYSFWLIIYITFVTVIVCQGDARYRTAVQPFMALFAVRVIDRLLYGMKGNRTNQAGQEDL